MKLLPKGSKLYSIFSSKCPRCAEGDIFPQKNPYILSTLFKTHTYCSNCGLKFVFEPGFFYGSMYVSYGLTIAIFVATYLVHTYFFEPSLAEIMMVLAIVLIIASPFVFRISRVTWMNFFIKYNPDKRGPNR